MRNEALDCCKKSAENALLASAILIENVIIQYPFN